MKTATQQTATVRGNTAAKVISAKLRALENQREKLEVALATVNEIFGEGTPKRKEAASVKHATRHPHRGAPNELYHLLELLEPVNGDFTVDRAVKGANSAKLGFSRSDVMNHIQSLVKKGRVKVVKSGLGRAVATYAIVPESHVAPEVKVLPESKIVPAKAA